ncbi:MAG TPA: acyl-ACP--UDP-N-acetylglucosamine O-acyltransferase [Victivallales bacterium]|mgnify:CR=1 FL=1|nr:acyl-ACP--UDP-N-acetylglucosamine O-acyltransferase [Victivallales bacterium]HPO91318.1 acyl-ACP--UDP-N-acetylglucosamine O-acyltransferase [Victivallales bacterium]HRR28479.1 acyl-ACP--UDP-N-acetylglucosamine O-acyltransferase [Victivallales bacterium]HRU00680.1 acyl-ACP--UDP-N-acetylglucosamine O-acyltransferase [Victivallales bacterium]
MTEIHPTAIIDKNAKIAENVKIGPYCIIGPDVEIGENNIFISHCSIVGYTKIGSGNKFFPFVSVGSPPQDYAFKGTTSYVRIGNGNIFREGFTVNPGTKEDSETIIGNYCYFMMNSHVAHNCKVGDRVIMANCAQLSGYVEVGSNAILSGLTGVHQFCRIGRFAMMSGGSTISMDLPPFMIASGRNSIVAGVNLVGLKRNGFPKETINIILDLYKIFFKEGLNTTNAIIKAEQDLPKIPEVIEFIDFVKGSKKGILNRQKEGR